MNFKLAKQLKDAGFPQDFGIGHSYYEFISHPRKGISPQQSVNFILNDEHLGLNEITKNWVKIPTIDELIKECIKFGRPIEIVINPDLRSSAKVVGRPDHYGGDTPLEAVAKLYIKLNEKNRDK